MAATATSIQPQERRERVPRGSENRSKNAKEDLKVKMKMDWWGLLGMVGLMVVEPEDRSAS